MADTFRDRRGVRGVARKQWEAVGWSACRWKERKEGSEMRDSDRMPCRLVSSSRHLLRFFFFSFVSPRAAAILGVETAAENAESVPRRSIKI